MSNVCTTDYYINVYYNLDTAKDFYVKLDEVIKSLNVRWVGAIGEKLGVNKIHERFATKEDGTLIPSRSDILDYSLGIDDDEGFAQIHLLCVDAWKPYPYIVMKLVEKYLPGAEIIYTAEECGTGIFDTNDPTVAGFYAVDVINDIAFAGTEIVDEQAIDGGTLSSRLQRYLSVDFDDIGALIAVMHYRHPDDVRINEWQYNKLENYLESTLQDDFRKDEE